MLKVLIVEMKAELAELKKQQAKAEAESQPPEAGKRKPGKKNSPA